MLKSVKQWMLELSPACKQASEWQSQALDSPLSARKRVGLWIHLRLCKWCRRYGRQIAFLRQACHKCDEHAQEAPPAALSQQAREKLKQAIGQRAE
jgi:hypothetical protein